MQNNISLHEHTTGCLSIHLLMETLVASIILAAVNALAISMGVKYV